MAHRIAAIDVNRRRLELCQVRLIDLRISADDHDVTQSGPIGRGAVDGNDARTLVGTDRMGNKAPAVVDFVAVILLVFHSV